ncbi:MAG: adenylyl-sulfate kinase [Arcobacteraceae bacterium]|nr:adenylyl-sulfate kinase [Arcobacteraceae bacterium]
MVIWLLGISGAGKTTLGNALKEHFDNKNVKSCIIDGDLVRDFYDNDLGYKKEDRIANIKRIMLSTYLLEQNDIIPIVCNISPYQDLRNFSKKKFDTYIEVYLKKDLQDITNKNEVYNSVNVIGVDLEFDEPTNSNLIIDTSKIDIKDSLKMIVEYVSSLDEN